MTLMRDNIPKSVKISPASYVMLSVRTSPLNDTQVSRRWTIDLVAHSLSHCLSQPL